MAEEKPFEPTASKLRKARKEGNVARSTEVNTVAAFTAGLIATAFAAPMIARATESWIASEAASGGRFVLGPFMPVLGLTAVPLVCSAIAGVGAGMAQTGGPVIVAPSLKFDRLKPTEGFKRMFSMQSSIAAAKALLVFSIAGVAVALVIRRLLSSGVAGSYEPRVFTYLASAGITEVLGVLVGIGALFAAIDVFVVIAQWRKKLRMDLYELKRETRESEGDPYQKGRRKSLYRNLVRGSINRVSEASFVVTNPTHIAVAMQYAPPEVSVPLVLCMAADESAHAVRAVAREHEIPIVENVALARALYETAEVDRTIPRESFVAVAEIVAALGRTKVLR